MSATRVALRLRVVKKATTRVTIRFSFRATNLLSGL